MNCVSYVGILNVQQFLKYTIVISQVMMLRKAAPY